MHRFFFFLLSLLVSASAQEYAGLSPQEAVKKMTVPPGFKVDLIAAEPDIVQPIAFTFDARGRIWVVEGNTYPQRAGNPPPARAAGSGNLTKPDTPQQKDIFGGKDRVLIFEDKDGDGSFETRKVFIENLNLVSGLELGFGGVYIGAAPYLMHIPDANGDDVPDGPPSILLDGFGWQDTHETLNSFIWGPDGWLYGCHGVFTHSKVGAPGTPDKDRVPMNCAYWRFHPVRKTFEIFAHGTSNSWGLDYNENGDWFSEACVIPHFWHIIQGGYYLRQSNPLGHFNPYVYNNIETIADHKHYVGDNPHAGNGKSEDLGGGHAHCGLCIYNGDNFPPEYRGRPLFFNIHGRCISQENLVAEGSGFVAKHLPDFLKTNDPWFTGVALKVGPDGAVYFIDWYDPQKCHKTDPLVWDRGNGRIYRVKYESTWKPWKGDATKDEGKNDGGWYERQRIKLSHESAPKTEKGIAEGWRFDFRCGTGFEEVIAHYVKTANLPGSEPIRSLWDITSGFQDITDTHLASFFLKGENADARKAAVLHFVNSEAETLAFKQAIGAVWQKRVRNAKSKPEKIKWKELSEDMIQSWVPDSPLNKTSLLEMAKFDPSPRVRLSLASALQRLPLADRWDIAEALILHAEDATDHNLPQMYWYAIEPLVPADPARALALAQKSKIPLVAQNIARRTAAVEGGTGYLVTALTKETTAAGAIYLLKAAQEGWRGRDGSPAPDGWDAAFSNIDNILKNDSAAPFAAEITDLREGLGVAFGDRRAFPRLRATVQDSAASPDRRQRALQTLLQGKDTEGPALLTALLADPALRLTAIRSLPGLSAAPDVLAKPVAALLTQYATLSPAEKQAAIATLSSRADWAGSLVDAIADQRIPRAELTSFAARQMVNFGNAALTEKLTKAWGSIGGTGGDTAVETAKLKAVLTPEFLRTANLPAGRALFSTTCGTCHALFGKGALLGPELTGSNRADLDYLLENILNPNALIGKDYELHLITLKDGRSIAGMVRGETAADLTVQSLTGSESVAKKDIAKHETPGISMMPPGQLTVFSKEQQRDLIAYLASPSQVPLPGEPGAENFVVANRIPGALEGEGLSATPRGGTTTPQPMTSFVRGNWNWSSGSQLWWTGAKPGDQLDLVLPVAVPGRYEVQIVLTKAPDYANLKFFLDGKPVGAAFDGFSPPGAGVVHSAALTLAELDLAAGDHRLTLEITGCNPEAAKQYMAGVDYVYLKRTSR
jgi:putative membrane-bound dehydrogenase-like protein